MQAPALRMPDFLCASILADLKARFAHLPARNPYGFTIGGDENPYLRRWFVTPRGEGCATFLHQFLRDDDNRALHDHPWHSVSIILSGGYIDHTPDGAFLRSAGDVLMREPLSRHRVELLRAENDAPVVSWTLFLVGPRVREWGFWCPDGGSERFVHWKDFTTGEHGERIGAGCGA